MFEANFNQSAAAASEQASVKVPAGVHHLPQLISAPVSNTVLLQVVRVDPEASYLAMLVPDQTNGRMLQELSKYAVSRPNKRAE